MVQLVGDNVWANHFPACWKSQGIGPSISLELIGIGSMAAIGQV